MTLHQPVLVELLSHNTDLKTALHDFTEIELADLFFRSAFLATAMQSELGAGKIKGSLQKLEQIETEILNIIKSKDRNMQKAFAKFTLQKMSALFEFEVDLIQKKKVDGLEPDASFYRTFDRLDELFNLDYASDSAPETFERLYSGGGVGVQSGYSTILTAIGHLNLQPGDRVIDLGSGFGRVGLVMGLLRDDIDFTGYEFVQHRADNAAQACRNFRMQDHVKFYACDLSGKFQIPAAEVYYMYDPFTDETYVHVLNQLIDISQNQKITIVTKGNARMKLIEVATRLGWPPHQEFDYGNLCLFTSR